MMMARRRRSENAGKVGMLLDVRKKEGEGVRGSRSTGSRNGFNLDGIKYSAYPKGCDLIIRAYPRRVLQSLSNSHKVQPLKKKDLSTNPSRACALSSFFLFTFPPSPKPKTQNPPQKNYGSYTAL